MAKSKQKLLTLSDFNAALLPEVAEKFKVVNIGKRSQLAIVSAKFGKINFTKLSLKQAEQLVKLNCPYLEPKKKG